MGLLPIQTSYHWSGTWAIRDLVVFCRLRSCVEEWLSIYSVGVLLDVAALLLRRVFSPLQNVSASMHCHFSFWQLVLSVGFGMAQQRNRDSVHSIQDKKPQFFLILQRSLSNIYFSAIPRYKLVVKQCQGEREGKKQCVAELFAIFCSLESKELTG